MDLDVAVIGQRAFGFYVSYIFPAPRTDAADIQYRRSGQCGVDGDISIYADCSQVSFGLTHQMAVGQSDGVTIKWVLEVYA